MSERFRELVSRKHKFSKGALSYEVEAALSQYVASYYTQTQSTKNALQQQQNPFPKVYELKQQIFKWLIDTGLYLEVPQLIPDKHLCNAIGAIKGTDSRTINKWVSLLKQCGCIKVIGIHQYEFV
jgi:hypothetical protein